MFLSLYNNFTLKEYPFTQQPVASPRININKPKPSFGKTEFFTDFAEAQKLVQTLVPELTPDRIKQQCTNFTEHLLENLQKITNGNEEKALALLATPYGRFSFAGRAIAPKIRDAFINAPDGLNTLVEEYTQNGEHIPILNGALTETLLERGFVFSPKDRRPNDNPADNVISPVGKKLIAMPQNPVLRPDWEGEARRSTTPWFDLHDIAHIVASEIDTRFDASNALQNLKRDPSIIGTGNYLASPWPNHLLLFEGLGGHVYDDAVRRDQTLLPTVQELVAKIVSFLKGGYAFTPNKPQAPEVKLSQPTDTDRLQRMAVIAISELPSAMVQPYFLDLHHHAPLAQGLLKTSVDTMTPFERVSYMAEPNAPLTANEGRFWAKDVGVFLGYNQLNQEQGLFNTKDLFQLNA